MMDIPDIVRIREKCRRVITYFKHSSLAQDKLAETQNLIKILNHKLIIEVETRWNSTYEMFVRLLEQKRAVVLALATLTHNFELLTDHEWNTLGLILPILRIFFLVTKEISSEKNITLSKIIPLKKQLSTLLYVTTDSTDDIGLDQILRKKLIIIILSK